MTEAGMVIIGMGEAGVRAASTLREQGFEGPVTLIGDETHLPYERPPLSKQAMLDTDGPRLTLIADAARFQDLNIDLRLGVRAKAIDRDTHTVLLNAGQSVPYRKLLLATGATPRMLSIPGAGPENVHYLRTFSDAVKLKSRLAVGTRLVIIGGGFIGLELAASAIGRGCEVTVIEQAPRILGRAVPAVLAEQIAVKHLDAGVSIITGVALSRIERDGDQEVVCLADGCRIAADTVVAGIGAEPEVKLAKSSGLVIGNGICVDNTLVTSDPDILAAGDCCSFPHALFDDTRMRLEAWRNAQDQGAHAARVMMGISSAFSVAPWFWSDQYDLTLQIAGCPDQGAITIERQLDEGTTLYLHLRADGRLVGASAFGLNGAIAREIRVAEMLIQRGSAPAQDLLRDPAKKLKSLLAA